MKAFGGDLMKRATFIIIVCFGILFCLTSCYQGVSTNISKKGIQEGSYFDSSNKDSKRDAESSRKSPSYMSTRVVDSKHDTAREVGEVTASESAGKVNAANQFFEWNPRDLRTSYKIGVGDELEIVVPGHNEVSGKVKVRSSGEIFIPLTNDRIEAHNLTPAELASEIKHKIKRLFTTENKIEVFVSVEECKSKVCYVFGETMTQGKIDLPLGRVTLRDVLIKAGESSGETGGAGSYFRKETAMLDRVRLIRPDKDNPRKAQYWVVDARKILYYNIRKDDLVVHPGDVVLIPSAIDAKLNEVLRRINRTFGLGRETDFQISNAYRRATGHVINPAP